jgi:nucleobase transporter 1/2
MPYAMVAGLFCIMFGLIASVGLSQMQHTDQNSPRNLFILGFALFMGLSVPDYFDVSGLAGLRACSAAK